MRPEPVKRKKKFHMGKGRRYQILAWSVVVGMVALLGGGATYAWYTLKEREAETAMATVMKPYYLSLRNPDESDVLQLSIGSLLQGKVKQIVFCVSSEEAQQKNLDTAKFNYALELVHTDNLALKYEIYPLEKLQTNVDEAVGEVITTEHDVTLADGTDGTKVIHWQKSGGALTGKDVSAERWAQAGLLEADDGGGTGDGMETGNDAGTDTGTGDDTGAEFGDGTTADADTATKKIINRGTYISYEVTVAEDGNTIVDNDLVLTAGAKTAQYFVLEIEWAITSGFEKYDKETDMIYLLAKAVQPQPE